MEKDIIIHTPTKEDWKRVVQTAFDRGNRWAGGEKGEKDICLRYWKYGEDESCIDIGVDSSKGRIQYCDKNWYQKNYSNIPILTPDEYIYSCEGSQLFRVGDKVKIKGKSVGDSWGWIEGHYPNFIGYITKICGDGSGRDDNNCLMVDSKPNTNNGNFFAPQDLELIKQPDGEVWDSPYFITKEYTGTLSGTFYGETKSEPKGKTMGNLIKNAFKSKKQKALDYYHITNGDGGLTEPKGAFEFVHYIYETNKDTRKGFTQKIVEMYEEETK